MLYLDKEYSYIRLFGFEEAPFLLPKFVIESLFILELCKKYMFWFSFFDENCKHQFIQIPFFVANVHVKNVTHLKEVAKDFELCEYFLALVVKGSDPEGIFVAHLKFDGYSNLTKIFTPREIEENPRSPEIVISTNAKSNRLKERKPRTSERPKGKSLSHVGSLLSCPIHPSPSNRCPS